MINSLNAISVAIKKNIILSLLISLILSLTIINVVYFTNINVIKQQNAKEVISNFDLLKSNISEKISIIANSPVFLDYLRSGKTSQQSLRTDFQFNIRTSKLSEISGIKIESQKGENIFTDGANSPYFLKIPLCYFDRGLDSKFGACLNYLILYLNKNEIIKSLKRINDKLIICANCNATDFLSGKNFGSFNTIEASKMPLFFRIKNQQGFNIFSINSIILIIMVVLATLNWRRTNHILGKHLSDPLKRITSTLKGGGKLNVDSEIDELVYLINQIRDREAKLNEAKENENLVVVGRIASQFAHDIRSPLAVINAIVEKISEISAEKRTLIRNATQQANNIANSLLSQYKNELANSIIGDQSVNTNKLCVLLDLVVKEKIIQYNHLPVKINYEFSDNDTSTIIDSIVTDFKRVISNIINNAVEAIKGEGTLTVSLISSKKMAHIKINDTGVGMKQGLILKILNGKSITNKKNGAGIGLASAFKLIKSWCGELDIASQPNIGTTISISLPIINYELSQNREKKESPDLILIDDNKVVTDAWEFAALYHKKKIVVFNAIDEVNQKILKYDRDTLICIDSELGISIRGELYAKHLYDQGFINIYLTTGHPNSSFSSMPWIKNIVGKDPIF